MLKSRFYRFNILCYGKIATSPKNASSGENIEILTKNGRSRQIIGDFTLKPTFQQIDHLFGLKSHFDH